MPDLYRKTKLSDQSGDYDVVWDMRGSVGIPLLCVGSCTLTPAEQAFIDSGDWRLDVGRALAQRDFVEIGDGTATLNKATDVINHSATDLIEE